MSNAVRCIPLLGCLLFLAGPVFAAAGDDKPGNGDSVKKWPAKQTLEQVKKANRPICLYVYLGETVGKSAKPITKNPDAEFLEGADFLGNKDVQKKLGGFQCIKLDVAAKKLPEGWPENLIAQAQKMKYGVMLFTSDMSLGPVAFAHNAEAAAPNFIKVCDLILKKDALNKMTPAEREEQAKEEKEEKEKAAQAAKAPAADNNKVNLGGLDDNKDKKKDAAAPNTPPPKPAGADNE